MPSHFKKLKSKFSKKERVEYLEEVITDILEELKDHLSDENPPFIEELKKKFTKEIGEKLIFALDVDVLLRGIENLYSIKKHKKKNTINYINRYIDSLEGRLKEIYGLEEKEPKINPFKKWEEVAKKKPEKKIKSEQFELEKGLLQAELLNMVYWLQKNDKRLIVLCEGRDAAGKGSFIKTAIERLKPGEHYRVNTFGIPTPEEKKDWFRRYVDVLPRKEYIAFYDRSWYNRAVVEPVMEYCTKEEYDKFMGEVISFEEKLIQQGFILIKFWFSITKETQQLRFELRQASPIKFWKFSENDAKILNKWDRYTYFKKEMFRLTSTQESPWVVVDSNDKGIAKLNAMRYILNKVPYDNKHEKILQMYPEVIYEYL